MPVLHTIAIVLHALSATGAFLVGIVLLFQSNTLRQLQLARAVLVLLILMAVFLVIAILSHVTSLPTIKQLIFGGLVILVVYMIWRAVQAVTVLTKQHQEDQMKVLDHVGFVLISLFDGFAIVSALDLHAPGWLVAVVAVGAVALGISAINVRKKTLTMQSR
jgi:Ca2+/Na+ antiporter